MSRGNIVLSYKGEALEQGVMDVNELAPALLSTGDLLQRANRLLNGGATRVKVNVRAGFHAGSFEVAFDILQSLVEQVKILIGDGDRPYTAKEILGFLGFTSNVAGITGVNVIEAVRLIRGRKVKKAVMKPDDSVDLTVEGDGNVITINKNVYNIFADPHSMKSLSGILRPLESRGIDALEFKEDGRAVNRVEKREVDYFRPAKEADTEIEYTVTTRLKVVGVFFEGKSMWKFSEGDNTFSAAITDQDFLKRLDERRVAFTKGDSLLVEMTVRQRKKDGNIRVEREIVRIIDRDTYDQIDQPELPT